MQASGRTVVRPKSFKDDYKREARSGAHAALEEKLKAVIQKLAANKPLDSSYQDHKLSGYLKDYRECHIKPDLLLIYKKTKDNTLILYRLGSHSELFG